MKQPNLFSELEPKPAAPRTRAVHVREAFDVVVCRAFGPWREAGPLNPVPGRFGNPFTREPINDIRYRKHLLETYFGEWTLNRQWSPTRRLAVLQDAEARMAKGGDPLKDFSWYLELRTQYDGEYRGATLALKGKRLACYCKPGPCHGDVLASWVDTHA